MREVVPSPIEAALHGAEVAAAQDARATLHTKAFVVDRKTSFIGSFNFNQRSINRDSESGVLIESETISLKFAEGVESRLREAAWELFLDEQELWDVLLFLYDYNEFRPRALEDHH